MKKSAHIRVYGIVQGVGMRYSTYRKATALSLTGYVKNLSDGSVEIKTEGEEKDIMALIDYIRTGLRWAQVDDMDVTWGEYKGKYNDFDIKY
ncbi:MAG: acylphosphatase [Thermoanaerobacteraceae bacterium]|jgi:acylphosphatase|nr:acylphosphatase [Thermoanaerobacteraceae bacterium]MDN5311769.1 acylphosphatase [Thermoanaerobacteraceae bacterium]